MNVEFKVLWFEDENDWYNMAKIRVEKIIREHVLEPVLIKKEGDDFNINELMNNEYDLILMDFKLVNKITGDSIAKEIRKNNVLTDILFYSSEEELMINSIMESRPIIDGIYITKRDYAIFEEKIHSLIMKIVRRSEDIVNLRGFVLDNTSNFEVRIKDIIKLSWEKFSIENRNQLDELINELLEKKKDKINKNVSKIKEEENVFLKANDDKYLLSVIDRLEILQNIIKILFDESKLLKTENLTGFKQKYIDDINVFRNGLGHAKLDDRKIFVKGKEVEVNQELHRRLRKNIIFIDDIILEIEKCISTL